MSAQLYSRYVVYDDGTHSNNAGLALGAWIGIVVAIVVVKILIIVAICYLCKRRDRRRRQTKMANPLYQTPGYTTYAPQGPPPIHGETGYNNGYYPPQETGKLQPQPYQHELQSQSAQSFESMPLKEGGRNDH